MFFFFGYFGMYSSVSDYFQKDVGESRDAVKCSELFHQVLGRELLSQRCHFIYMQKLGEDTQAESKQLKHLLNQNLIIYIFLRLFMANIKS